MKKLGKKLEATMDTIEAYCYCYCSCEPSKCQTQLGSIANTVNLGIHLQYSPSTWQEQG